MRRSAFTHWLRRLSYANGEDLQIMYGIRGERDLTERELTHLSGYCDSRPVRVGNGAAKQKQLDVFGEVLDCIHLYRRQGGFERYGETLEGPLWEMMRALVEHVCEHWQEPDSGIWEVRGGAAPLCLFQGDVLGRPGSRHSRRGAVRIWRPICRAGVIVRDQIRADILFMATILALARSLSRMTTPRWMPLIFCCLWLASSRLMIRVCAQL